MYIFVYVYTYVLCRASSQPAVREHLCSSQPPARQQPCSSQPAASQQPGSQPPARQLLAPPPKQERFITVLDEMLLFLLYCPKNTKVFHQTHGTVQKNKKKHMFHKLWAAGAWAGRGTSIVCKTFGFYYYWCFYFSYFFCN